MTDNSDTTDKTVIASGVVEGMQKYGDSTVRAPAPLPLIQAEHDQAFERSRGRARVYYMRIPGPPVMVHASNKEAIFSSDDSYLPTYLPTSLPHSIL